jgi:Lon-like ATP-dependent protease
VDWYSDVFDIVFPNSDAAEVNLLWKDSLKKSKEDKNKDKEDDDED